MNDHIRSAVGCSFCAFAHPFRISPHPPPTLKVVGRCHTFDNLQITSRSSSLRSVWSLTLIQKSHLGLSSGNNYMNCTYSYVSYSYSYVDLIHIFCICMKEVYKCFLIWFMWFFQSWPITKYITCVLYRINIRRRTMLFAIFLLSLGFFINMGTCTAGKECFFCNQGMLLVKIKSGLNQWVCALCAILYKWVHLNYFKSHFLKFPRVILNPLICIHCNGSLFISCPVFMLSLLEEYSGFENYKYRNTLLE